MIDLFEHADRYPHAPARGKTDTSAAAAKKLTNHGPLRQKILDLIRFSGDQGYTTSEITDVLAEPLLNVRPRVTELRMQNEIASTGMRRKNALGNSEIVWRSI